MYFPMQEAIMNTVFLIYSAYQEDGVFYDDKTEDFPDKFTYGTVFPCHPAFDRWEYDKYF